MFQFLFNRRLSNLQWMALCILTIGCIIQKVDWSQIKNDSNQNISHNDIRNSQVITKTLYDLQKRKTDAQVTNLTCLFDQSGVWMIGLQVLVKTI